MELYNACDTGDVELVKALLAIGENPNIYSIYNDMTPLYVASMRGYADIVELLIDDGAKLDFFTNKGGTSLSVASYHGHASVVKVLLDSNIDPDFQDNSGATALHIAAKQNCIDCVKLLLEYGANIYLETNIGYTALRYACEENHIEIVKLLLETGGAVLNTVNGVMALSVARKRGYNDVVEMLEKTRETA